MLWAAHTRGVNPGTGGAMHGHFELLLSGALCLVMVDPEFHSHCCVPHFFFEFEIYPLRRGNMKCGCQYASVALNNGIGEKKKIFFFGNFALTQKISWVGG